MDSKPKKRNLSAYFFPTSAIRRSVDAIRHTHEQVSAEFKANLPDQQVSASYPEDDLRNIKDSKERFRAMYVHNKWTEPEILEQIRISRVTKMVSFVMAIISVTSIVLVSIFAPRWVLLFFICGAGATMLIGMAKGFQYALYEAQLKLKDLISAREFVSREDFFTRLLG